MMIFTVWPNIADSIGSNS